MTIHAEFMQVWEEGYVSRAADVATMHTQSMYILDGAALRDAGGRLDVQRVRDYVASEVATQDFFRVRLQRGVLGLTPPAWVPDERFDVDRHLVVSPRRLALVPENFRALSGWDGGVMSLRHPLWRFHVTELEDGDVALGMIFHHASLDGLSGMRAMASVTRDSDDLTPTPPAGAPFGGARAARAYELPVLAARSFLGAHRTPATAWRAFTARPPLRRARRVAARVVRPWRELLTRLRTPAPDLPNRGLAYTVFPVRDALAQARAVGGTLGDLLAAALILASHGAPEVSIRYPVSHHATSDVKARNNVRDMAVYGRGDADLAELVASIKAQVATVGEGFPEALRVGREIGYATLVPWLSRPRYFAGARIKELIGFPASVLTDEIAAAAVMYDGRLMVSAITQGGGDPQAAIATFEEAMTGRAPGHRATTTPSTTPTPPGT